MTPKIRNVEERKARFFLCGAFLMQHAAVVWNFALLLEAVEGAAVQSMGIFFALDSCCVHATAAPWPHRQYEIVP